MNTIAARPSPWQVFCHDVSLLNREAIADAKATLAPFRRAAGAVADRAAGRPRPVARPQAPRFAWASRAWQSPDYRRQFVGRMCTQAAQGVYYGASVLLLNMYGGPLRYAGSQLADNTLRALELFANQGGALRRSRVEDDNRNRPPGAPRASVASTARPRHLLATALLYSWVGEVALAGCFLGIVAFRCASWLTARRMLMALGTARVARAYMLQSQWANFDGLKGAASAPDIARDIQQTTARLRWLEQTAGMTVNAMTGLAIQSLPLLVPPAAMVGVVVGLTLTSVALGLIAKLSLVAYLQEGTDDPDVRGQRGPGGAAAQVAPPAGS